VINMTPELGMPLLKPWWRITYEATRVIFQYGDDVIVCEGKGAAVIVPRIVPLLDGGHSVEDIVAQLGAHTAPFVAKLLELFVTRGMLIEGPPVPAAASPAARDAVHFVAATIPRYIPLADDAATLAGLRVGIMGSSVAATEAARSLSSLGAATPILGWEPSILELEATDLVLVAPTANELPELAPWNERAIAARVTWFQVLPFDGRFAAIGPLYIPGETACYECFRHRRAANVSYAPQYWAMQETPAPFPSTLPLDQTLAGLATLSLLRWHMRSEAGIPGNFQSLEFGGDITIGSQTVYRVPRCTACASVGASAPVLPWYEEVARWTA
jgi:bacteriocin biosynthesis cyclodehydratase domain-containing protein